jgi:hypothetical protein
MDANVVVLLYFCCWPTHVRLPFKSNQKIRWDFFPLAQISSRFSSACSFYLDFNLLLEKKNSPICKVLTCLEQRLASVPHIKILFFNGIRLTTAGDMWLTKKWQAVFAERGKEPRGLTGSD